jgi:hypothetical protein
MYEVKKYTSSCTERSINYLLLPLQFPEFVETFIIPEIRSI